MRYFWKIEVSIETMWLEGLVLWVATLFVMIFLRLLPQPYTKIVDIYPYNWSTVSRYFLIVVFVNGIIALDWQILKSNLQVQQYEHVAEIRIYFERFLLPILVSIASAALLDSYRLDSTAIQLNDKNETSKFNFNTQKFFVGVAILTAITTIFGANFFDILDFWPLALGLGYLIFGINSFYLDQFQARVKLVHLLATLGIFSIAYGVIAVALISRVGIQGHVLLWSVGNLILLGLISSQSSPKKNK